MEENKYISLFFDKPAYHEYENDGQTITIEEQKEYVRELRSKLNSFKTHSEQIEFLKNHRTNDNTLEMQNQLWKVDKLQKDWTFKGDDKNLHYKFGNQTKETLFNKSSNRGIIDDQMRTMNDRFKTRNKDRTDIPNLQSKKEKDKELSKAANNMKARYQKIAATRQKSNVFNKKTSYVKRNRKGKIITNRKGKPKTYGLPAKGVINLYNNTLGSKLGRGITFVILNWMNILIGIATVTILVLSIFLISGAIGFTHNFGRSPFILCGSATTDKIEENNDSKASNIDVTKVNFSDPKLSDVEIFLSAPITDTFGVSDDKIEKTFLDRNLPISKKYGIDASNIKDVTKKIKDNGVSPVFFYIYAMNEVSFDTGAGSGFINHYAKGANAPGGIIVGNSLDGDIKADTEYIKTQSKVSGGTPATGGGEPASLPTEPAAKIYTKLASGTLGKIYIPATSAVTAEIADLSGQTGPWSGLFGKPVSDMMVAISKLGVGAGAENESSDDADGVQGTCEDTGSDSGDKTGNVASKDAMKAIIDANKKYVFGSGQCYSLSSQYVSLLTGGKYSLGADGTAPAFNGVTQKHITGSQLSNDGRTMNASDIWSTYDWKAATNSSKYKFTSQSGSDLKYSDLRPGDILSYTNSGSAGHTVIIATIDGNNKYSVYEQNVYWPDKSPANGYGSSVYGPDQRTFVSGGVNNFGERIAGVVHISNK